MTLAVAAHVRDWDIDLRSRKTGHDDETVAGTEVTAATSPHRMPASEAPDFFARARLIWPRLTPPRDPTVRRDPERMASHVARRTALPIDAILVLLEIP